MPSSVECTACILQGIIYILTSVGVVVIKVVIIIIMTNIY